LVPELPVRKKFLDSLSVSCAQQQPGRKHPKGGRKMEKKNNSPTNICAFSVPKNAAGEPLPPLGKKSLPEKERKTLDQREDLIDNNCPESWDPFKSPHEIEKREGVTRPPKV